MRQLGGSGREIMWNAEFYLAVVSDPERIRFVYLVFLIDSSSQ